MADRVQADRVIGTKVLRPRQQVEETIRTAILAGELSGGEMLPPEAELARQFNVSRTTLREALRTLVSQRLIVKVPGARGGNIVQSVTANALGRSVIDSMETLLALGRIEQGEVADVRLYLEVPAVRLAAVHRSQEQLSELTDVLDLQRHASVDNPDVKKWDAQFHSLIATASGNRVLATLVTALHQATQPVDYLELSPEVGRETVRQHQRILEAIDDQDPDRSQYAIEEHLAYLREHWRRE